MLKPERPLLKNFRCFYYRLLLLRYTFSTENDQMLSSPATVHTLTGEILLAGVSIHLDEAYGKTHCILWNHDRFKLEDDQIYRITLSNGRRFNGLVTKVHDTPRAQRVQFELTSLL